MSARVSPSSEGIDGIGVVSNSRSGKRLSLLTTGQGMGTLEDHRLAVLEEIRLIIVEALRNGDAIRPDSLAMVVHSSYPNCGLSEEQIAVGIRGAAAEADVKVVAAGAEPIRGAASAAHTQLADKFPAKKPLAGRSPAG